MAWQHGVHSYEQTLVLGLFLGFAGASFAVALRWPPSGIRRSTRARPGHRRRRQLRHGVRRPLRPGAGQGLWLDQRIRLRADPLILTLVVFVLCARNARNGRAQEDGGYGRALNDKDSWWFMFFYSVTFGASSALPAPCRLLP